MMSVVEIVLSVLLVVPLLFVCAGTYFLNDEREAYRKGFAKGSAETAERILSLIEDKRLEEEIRWKIGGGIRKPENKTGKETAR